MNDSLPYLAEIAKTGIPGLAIAFACWVIWQLKTELTKVYDGRITDWKSLAEVIQNNSTTLAAQASASEARTRAAEALSRSQDLAAVAQTHLAEQVRALIVKVDEQAKEIVALKDELLRRGGGR